MDLSIFSNLLDEFELKKHDNDIIDPTQTPLWQSCLEAGMEKEDKPFAILSFDTDKIKEYVFASPKLPEIRGGSKLIEEALNAESIKKILENFQLPEKCIIYASGGGGMIILPENLVEPVGKAIEERFIKCTLGATVTWVYIRIHPMELVNGYRCLDFGFSRARETMENNRDLMEYFGCDHIDDMALSKWADRKCFGEIMKVLSSKLQQKKGERESVPFFETIPFAKRCASCGMRPVGPVPEGFERYEGGKDLCEVCWRKKERGLDDRKYEKDAEDLKAIGNELSGRAKGYVGVVYADGNGMGRVLQRLKTIGEYREWSRSVEKIIKTTVDNLLGQFGIEKQERLVTGGDDVILFLPANKTLAFTEKLVKEIQDGLREITPTDLQKGVGMSAGVVLAHHNYPALYLVEYAEQLLKLAKKHGKKDADNPQSAIDFAVLTDSSPLNTEISELRRSLYVRLEKVGKLKQIELNLLSRPYTLDEFSEFLDRARKLKTHVPHSQIHLMRGFVQNDARRVAELNFLYHVARCRRGNSWQKWIYKTTGEYWSTHEDLRGLIWKQQDDNTWSTPFIDYGDVYHFISSERGE